MKPTRRARALMAVAGGLYLAGFLALTAVPAVAATLLLVYLAHTRWSAEHAVRNARIQYERTVVETTVHAGDTVTLELSAQGTRLPHGIHLRITDQLPDGLEAVDDLELVGPTRRDVRVRAGGKGNHLLTRATARFTDARGLWTTTRPVRCETPLRVLAEREALEAGRRLSRRRPLEATSASQLGMIIRELEFDSFRRYQPGDRLRDLDWKRYAKLGELISKAWEKERESEVVLMLDAGRTMRARSRGATKLDHAASLALELAEAANGRSYAVGYVAFDELRIVDQVRPSRARGLPERLAERLSDLPSRVLTKRRLDVGLPGDAPADEREVDFLSTLQGLTAGSADGGRPVRSRDPGLRRALSRLVREAGDDTLFIVLFTDLERVPDEVLRNVARLRQRNHQVITVLLPGSRYLDPPETVRARDLENAYREQQTRRRARALLKGHGVPVVELEPGSTAAAIVAASEEDQPRARGGGPR